jgi:protein involved in polysaccharide export with SLBB domain
VPTQRLANGDARVNLVIRPGDVIRVPPQPSGNIFIGGQVQRAGTYQMIDKLTLTNALIAAGGLSSIAVQERVDLTRMVGNDRVATIRLNLRAIAERTHPEVYLKPNDQINVGTNFWATPLAVVRNGFRFSYGFGFLVDRNFGNDIFGPPPENNGFN